MTPVPTTIITKDRRKIDYTKRDKPYLEYIQISAKYFKRSSRSAFTSEPRSGPWARGRRCGSLGRDKGCVSVPSSSGSAEYLIPLNFPCPKVFPTFVFPFIQHWVEILGVDNCWFRAIAHFIYG